MDAAERLAAVRLIVVHGGLAHMDDIMSCAIAYAFGVPHDAPIERRNPTPEELDSEKVLVMDVGGVHDPARLDFDHHQRAVTDEPKCAFRLLAEWLGAHDELSALCPWYTAWNYIDVCGTARTAAIFGAPKEALAGLVSNPLSDWVIRRFADNPELRRKLSTSRAAAGVRWVRRSLSAQSPDSPLPTSRNVFPRRSRVVRPHGRASIIRPVF